MLSFELNLTSYKGPIEKLLELIESRELEISEISLAAVTDDFVKYLEKISEAYREEENGNISGAAKDEYMRFLSDFIVVASRLVFIKSKTLLPDLRGEPEEEAAIKELEERLRQYRELRPAMKSIADLWRKGSMVGSREYFLHVRGLLLAIRSENGSGLDYFYPGKTLSCENILSSLTAVLALTMVPEAEEKMIREKITTLEEKIREIITAFKTLKETTFRGIAGGASKVEAIVAFLAILHLARDQVVALEQESHGSDIIIRQSSRT